MKLERYKQLITRKRLIIFLIVLLVAAFFLFQSNRNKKDILQYSEVSKKNIQSTVSASGTLNGKTTANLRFKGTGKLAFINIKQGDAVEEGDVIAGLDTTDLSIALQQAQNTLRDKQAIVDKTLDDIHQYQYGSSTTGETQTQRQNRTTAEAARDNAFDSVKNAQRAFSDATIVSPITGVVTKADPVAGQVVSLTDTIAQVVDDSEIFFDIDVDEADIGKVSVNQRADITLDAYPNRTFRGLVTQIMPFTKTLTSGANVITVRVGLDASGIHFVSGLNGQASIITAEKLSSLVIPSEALRDDNTVLISKNNQIEIRKVVPGITSDTETEILEGLNEKEQIITNPAAAKIPARQSNPLLQLFRRPN